MKSLLNVRLTKIIDLLVLFISLIFLILIVFPTYSIFGYSHQILSSADPDLYITISEQPLFHVISDNYYSTSLKTGYIILFIIEIFSILSCLSLLLVFILKREKIIKALFIASSVFLIVLAILIISFFKTNPLVLGVSITCLLIIVVNSILNIIFVQKSLNKVIYK